MVTAAFCSLLSFGNSKLPSALKALILVQTLVCAIVTFFDLQLILFHMWLVSKRITTYEYIHYKREREEKRQMVKRGELTQEQYAEWERTALVDPERPKSKTIVRLDQKAVRDQIAAEIEKRDARERSFTAFQEEM